MNTKLTAAISLALAMAACASAPQPNLALENARSAVRSAEADPNVATYAALDMHTARSELDAAEAAAAARDEKGIAQPAYLATQTAHLAQLKASEMATKATMKETCEKCGRKEVRYSEQQLRGADEGSTIFYECDCGHKYATW